MKGLKKLSLLLLLSLLGFFSADVCAEKKRFRAEEAEKASSASDEGEEVGEGAAVSVAAGAGGVRESKINKMRGKDRSKIPIPLGPLMVCTSFGFR